MENPFSVTASAPGRCGIIGNPSDIYGGKVLSCSIPARATCTLTATNSETLPEDTRLWDAAISRLPIRGAWEVHWSTHIPRSSGLSGSTALLAATLACILAVREETPDIVDPKTLIEVAEMVRDVERNGAGIVCGYQDAYMVVHGGLQFMDFAGKHPREPGPPARLTPLNCQLPFLLITTGVERLSGSVHGPTAERWLSGDREVISAMERIAALAEEGKDALLRHDLRTLGKAMSENHELVASLGGSGEAIDRLIADCIKDGAIAAKLAGAGLGGTVIALTDDRAELEGRLTAKGYSRFLKPEATAGLRYESVTTRRISA